MTYQLHIKDNIKFAKISGDQNKIHIDKNYAKNFFFKNCVVHGANLVALGLSKFFKKNSRNCFFINELDIKFINYIEIGEKFVIEVLKDKVIVKNNINDKLEIKIKYKKSKEKYKIKRQNKLTGNKYYFSNLLNQDLVKQLLNLTKKIGTDIFGNGSLILKISVKSQYNNTNKSHFEKINKNAFNYFLISKDYKINCLVIKIKPYKRDKFKIKLNKGLKKYLKDKSVIIFGSNGTLGSFTKNYLSKYGTKLHLVNRIKNQKSSLSINYYGLKNLNFLNIKKIIKKANPDYVFYYASPKIVRNNKKNINKELFNLYRHYYVTVFYKILNLLKKFEKKIFIFYPSSVALNEKSTSFKYSKEYRKTKELGERVCKLNFSKKIFPISYRIDQIKSPQNYNIAGFYEGSSERILKKYIDNFLIKSHF